MPYFRRFRAARAASGITCVAAVCCCTYVARTALDKQLSKLADTYVDAAVSYMDPGANGLEFEEALAQLTKARDEFTAFSRDKR